MNFNPSEEEINFVNDALRVLDQNCLKLQNQKLKSEDAILFMLIQ